MGKVIQRRIVITGGAGFIGYHLAMKLSEDAANHISLVDNFARHRPDEDIGSLTARANVRMISGDLTNKMVYKQLGRGYDEVYHLAAIIGVCNVIERPEEVLRVNAIATLYLLEWFVNGGGKKLLFSSTSEAYAWTQLFYKLAIPTPEDVPLALTDLDNPRASYAGSKIFGELAVRQYCGKRNKPFAIVRYHNVYGPRMGYEHVIPELYGRVISGQGPLTVYSADHSRAFCYVSDAVTATISAMRQEIASGKTFNVGNDKEEISIGELAKRILKKAGVCTKILPRKNAADVITRRSPDISRARKLLGYRPSVSLDEGLDLALSWYKDKFKLRGRLSRGVNA